MNFIEFLIRRPVLSWVMSIILILLGGVSYQYLQLRQFPKIERPVVSIVTQYEGASPQIIEAQITKLLEDAVSGIEGLDTIVSTSAVGESKISLTFRLDRPMEAAANDVRDRVSRKRDKLPRDVTDPSIRKSNADAQAIVYLALFSDRHDTLAIGDFAENHLKSQFEAMKGVATVDLMGGGVYEMRVVLDPTKMAGFQITSGDVVNALKRQNVEKPAGHIQTDDQDIVLSTSAGLSSEQDFDDLIIGEKNGYLIRLGDVGHAELTGEDKHFRVRYNGKPAVGIGVTKQSIANPLQVSDEIHAELPKMRKSLPKGMKIQIATEVSEFIKTSINEVYETIFIATILVILVVFAFLRSARASLIPLVTIPISLIATFGLMYAFGFTINTLSLLALVLAIGLVVDDAIVMLENIYRHIEGGVKPFEAAVKGAREISFAVISMTVTLAAVYAPIALVQGLTGRLFTEFAITLAGAVIISGFVALTLSPMMCARLLRVHKVTALIDQESNKGAFSSFIAPIQNVLHYLDLYIENMLNWLTEWYGRALKKLLLNRLLVIAGAVFVTFLGGIILQYFLSTELTPKEDQGLVRARAAVPYNANLDFVDKYMRQAENVILKNSDIEKEFTMVQVPGDSTIFNVLKHWDDRTVSSVDIATKLNEEMADIAGISMFAYSPSSSLFAATGGKPVQVILQSTKPHDELVRFGQHVLNKVMPKIQGLMNVEADTGGDEGREYKISIDREKVSLLGLDVAHISETLDTLIGGKPVSHFRREGRRDNVIIETPKKSITSPDDLAGIYIRGTSRVDKKEVLVPLSELITVEESLAPVQIAHFDALRSVTISALLQEGYSLGDVLFKIEEAVQKELPQGVFMDFAGESRQFFQEKKNDMLIFFLALSFIFLVLAAQYESWFDPIVILISVPMAITGGFILLALTTGALNLYSKIGILTLIGLISKHGILIVDFANQRCQEGCDRYVSVYEAAKMRLRPILMTTFAMVFGAVPLALATGAGHESRQAIGWVIVGGMTLGTIFTLFVLPVFYTVVNRENAVWLFRMTFGLPTKGAPLKAGQQMPKA